MTFPDIKPNYEHSILNLTSTLAEKMGVQLEPEGLTEEALTEIDESTTILFLVLDGLGSNYLMKHGSGLWMHEHVVDSISSVFPPSTGSAMTTFYTGASPLQHGVTGWFVYLKEVGVVSRFLPFTTLVNDEPMGLDVSTFIGAENWLKKVKRSIFLGPDRIIDSPYSRFASRGCLRIGYKNMKHLFGEMRDRACNFHGQQFIFAYYPEIDAIAHDEGIESEAALKQVTKLDKNLEKLAKEIPSNARIIITADHGLVDIKQENTVRMGDHPELKKMLIAPVCGDTRTCYFYVRSHKSKAFQDYAEDNLGHACVVHESTDLIERRWFGSDQPSPEFDSRVGDFVAVMKEDYALFDKHPGQEYPDLVGQHGGLSKDEMLVPLIVS